MAGTNDCCNSKKRRAPADTAYATLAERMCAISRLVLATPLGLRPRPNRIVCFGDSLTFGSGVAGESGVDGEKWPGWLQRTLASAAA